MPKNPEWLQLPKGPELTDAELNEIKSMILRGIVPEDVALIRRLVQTLERHKFNRKAGFTEEFPPVGSVVYESHYDEFIEYVVLEHLETGEIKVLEHRMSPPVETVLSGWLTRPSFAVER